MYRIKCMLMLALVVAFLNSIVLVGSDIAIAAYRSYDERNLEATIPATADPEVRLTAVADACIRDRMPSDNFGTSPTMYSGNELDTGVYRSFILFDLSGIPQGATIINASFNAYVSLGELATIEVRRATQRWEEASVTWNNQPSVTSMAYDSEVISHEDEDTWESWDVTGLVRQWMNATPNYGLCLWGPGVGTGTAYAGFHTREGDTAPYLLINYTTGEEKPTFGFGKITLPSLKPSLIADAYVNASSYNRTKNFGTSPTMYSGYELDTGVYRSFVRFDLSGIPQGATIVSASFNAYVLSGSGGPFEVLRVTEVWEEASVTWNNQPSVTSMDYDSEVISYDDYDTFKSWSVTGLVREWMGGSPNYGLCLWGPELAHGMVEFSTREGDNAPYLNVLYTNELPPKRLPEPSPPGYRIGQPPTQSLIVDSAVVLPGETVKVPVRLENALNVASLGFNLTYDPKVVQCTDVSKGSLLEKFNFVPNFNEPGIIRFGFASAENKSGTGWCAEVEFKAVGSVGDATELVFSDFLATNAEGASVTMDLDPGMLIITDLPKRGDSNGDWKLDELDSLQALRMYVKLEPEDLNLDLNEDGAVTPDDARLILQQAAQR